MRPNISHAALLAAIFCSDMAMAQDAPPMQAFERCAAIIDDGERLGCYDRAVAAVSASAGAAVQQRQAAAAEAQAAEAARQQAARDQAFGRESTGERDEHLVATVSDVSVGRDRRTIVTLDNGQVWRQGEGISNLLLRPGREVTIKRGSLGSYRMVSEGRAGVMWVTRVK